MKEYIKNHKLGFILLGVSLVLYAISIVLITIRTLSFAYIIVDVIGPLSALLFVFSIGFILPIKKKNMKIYTISAIILSLFVFVFNLCCGLFNCWNNGIIIFDILICTLCFYSIFAIVYCYLSERHLVIRKKGKRNKTYKYFK